jgi:hypothetical protein
LSELLKPNEETIVIMKRVVTNTPSKVSTSKPKVTKPKSLGGARSLKESKNLFWDIEQYIIIAKINVAE